MKKLVFAFILVAACSPRENPEAREALNNLKGWVDTVYLFREGYLNGPDTEFMEVPVDPHNPSMVRIDTVVVSVEEKKKRGFSVAGLWQSVYDKRLETAGAHEKEMSKEMKHELEETKNRFEVLKK